MKNNKEPEIARRYAPRIFFDENEPFLPLYVGYTVVRGEEIDSPSFSRKLTPPKNGMTIEYAIYWDWDIGHHYDLEHLWVHVNQKGEVISFEGSAHGLYINLWPSPPELEALIKALKNKNRKNKYCPAEKEFNFPRIYKSGEGLLCYSQPGKHAFAPSADWYRQQQEFVTAECNQRAGQAATIGGVYGDSLLNKYRDCEELARDYLKRSAFNPTLNFNQLIDLKTDVELMSWKKLYKLIPERINYWMQRLKIDSKEDE
ncbi:hypothetical protein [Halanaerobium kushneri]|jgi:putative hydrolase of the HAD superfamily|uniref:Putative hydrolase of the HAD superfamily n=1 Tax=Halanaerobium kushneri TaxID=56779 RepID=A0A1N6ZW06_9FIRM|nr:hypothetical protein [Halanaerobium kushneri]SIR30987.1 putative hydrolase of the HAD superfamily [Halanaerobium kushneri]